MRALYLAVACEHKTEICAYTRSVDIPAAILQITMLRDLPASSFVLEAPDLANGKEGDHIFQVQLHDRLDRDLTSDQGVCVRKHWLVPSCPEHNRARSQRLEDISYLVHLIAFVIDARNISDADKAMEVRSFVDVAKIAHSHLAAELDYLRRAKREPGDG